VGRAQRGGPGLPLRGGRGGGFAREGHGGVGRVGKLVGLAALVVPLTTGCSVDEVLRFGWPIGVTPQAENMRTLWTWSCVAALVVGAITWGVMFWAMIFHRKRVGDDNVPPRQTQYNLPIEIVFTVVPTIIVAVLFAFTVQVQNNVNEVLASPDLKVNITAFQWNWQFTYPDTRTPTGAPITTIGTSDTIPLLVLPTDRSIQFT
jgi:cytochrome c oxidase subunit II